MKAQTPPGTTNRFAETKVQLPAYRNTSAELAISQRGKGTGPVHQVGEAAFLHYWTGYKNTASIPARYVAA